MNRLANESSPYLLQHQHNPVDWYPWGEPALRRARDEDKPIFLSIGYSACHWCHVMEHESFESDAIAALLNQHFVCIKVDREERPDLDHIYMQAVQMLTGRGGWPLSVFLTPDLQPFFGGTYWPPTSRMGMPGFDSVLLAVVEAWTHRRGVAIKQAAQITAHLRQESEHSQEHAVLDSHLLAHARARLAASFDSVHGGFGRAPKFPRPMDLQVLLRAWARERRDDTLQMVRLTLDKMAAGGMYDHLGGGFARYSVDDRWLVPHFEKMLYDNALLADAYLDGFLVLQQPHYARVAAATCDYVLRDMVDGQGGFHSTEDADSEGVEGKYYVWSRAEIVETLGPAAADRFCLVYGVTEQGNFEGHNILHLPRSVEESARQLGCSPDALDNELQASRDRLRELRDRRVRPGKDDKVLVSWNGLMIHTLARAAGILERPEFLHAAQRAARFVLNHLRRYDGRLLHCWRGGEAKLDAYLDDYAYLIQALATLYEADFDPYWIESAVQLAEIVVQHFHDPSRGGFFFTADDHEPLITRTKELHDGSVPGSNAMAATALTRLGKLTGRGDWLDAARRAVESTAGLMNQVPEATAQTLIALDLLVGPTWELALVADPNAADTREILSALRRTYIPRSVVACRAAGGNLSEGYPHGLQGHTDPPGARGHGGPLDALFAGKTSLDAEPALYVCEDFSCRAPVRGKPAILAAWKKLAEPA